MGCGHSRRQHKMDASQSMLIRLTEDTGASTKTQKLTHEFQSTGGDDLVKFNTFSWKMVTNVEDEPRRRVSRQLEPHQSPQWQVYSRRAQCSTLNGTKGSDKRQAQRLGCGNGWQRAEAHRTVSQTDTSGAPHSARMDERTPTERGQTSSWQLLLSTKRQERSHSVLPNQRLGDSFIIARRQTQICNYRMFSHVVCECGCVYKSVNFTDVEL